MAGHLVLVNRGPRKARRVRKSHHRRTHRGGKTHIGHYILSNPAKRRRRHRKAKVVTRIRRVRAKAVKRRVHRRRRSSGHSIGSIKAGIAGIFSKDSLILAGAVGAGVVAPRYLLNQYSDKLPGLMVAKTDAQGNPVKASDGSTITVMSPTMALAYSVAVPVGLALVLRKKNSTLAKGFAIAAGLNAINGALAVWAPSTLAAVQGIQTTTTASATTTKTTGAYLGTGRTVKALPQGSPLSTPGYSGLNYFTNLKPTGALPAGYGFRSPTAFRAAW